MKNDQAAFLNFEWDKFLFGPRLRVKDIELHPPLPSRIQRDFNPNLCPPGMAHKHPFSKLSLRMRTKSSDIKRLGVKKGAVLMTTDFTAYSRLLEDIHGLEKQWVLDCEVVNQLSNTRRARERTELSDRVREARDRSY